MQYVIQGDNGQVFVMVGNVFSWLLLHPMGTPGVMSSRLFRLIEVSEPERTAVVWPDVPPGLSGEAAERFSRSLDVAAGMAAAMGRAGYEVTMADRTG